MQSKYQQLQLNFRDKVDGFKSGPIIARQTNDICCCIVFVLMILTFIILGSYFIADQSSTLKQIVISGVQDSSNTLAAVFSKFYKIIATMFGLAILIAFAYMNLVRCFPKCMVYLLIVSVFCIMFAILIIGIANNNYGLVVAMSFGLFFFGIFLFCVRDQIEVGVKVLAIASNFVNQKPSVYLVPIWVLVLSALFFTFWVVSSVAVQCRANSDIALGNNTNSQLGVFAYFVFVYIFMCIFFYYVLSFMISTACADWYYGTGGDFFCKSVGRINKYHIGSFTFASLLLTIIKILQILISSKDTSDSNACVRFLQCCVNCILGQVQYLIRVMNNISVIVMAVTGQSYCQSAKTAAYVVFDNMGLFQVVSMISNLIMFGGIIFSVGIPTLIGILYCNRNQNPTDTELDHLGLVIFFGTIILVVFLICMVCEALDATFVLYCLDKRLNECGCIMAAPQAMREFGGYEVQTSTSTAHQLHEQKM